MLTSEPLPRATPQPCTVGNPAATPPAIDGERLLRDPEHIQRLQRIARKQTRGSGLDWEDAFQSAQIKILQAYRAGKFYHGDAFAFWRWASSVARFEIIDLVRKDKRQKCASLDQKICEGETTWLEFVADDFNALDSLVQSDLVERAIAAIHTLDAEQPDKAFLKLWEAKVKGIRQTDLAAELGMTQSAISKRWKELIQKLIIHLGWLEPQTVQPIPIAEQRQRSQTQW